MLSELEKELGRIRWEQEKSLFARLDEFFDDPSDENLSVLQEMRHDHKENLSAIEKERTRQREKEKADALAAAATSAIISSGKVAPTSTLKPMASAEIEKRMKEMTRKSEERIEEMRRQLNENDRLAREREELARSKRRWFDRLLGD